jgi:hypothetical protein
MPVTPYGIPQPLQWNVGSVCRYTSRSLSADVPAEGHRVEPEVAVGELHALGPRGGARRVVDRHGGVLVRHAPPRPGITAQEHLRVGGRPEHHTMLDGNALHHRFHLRIDERHRRSGVLDDVADLLRVQPEVDRHQHTVVHAHPEQTDEEPPRIGRHDRHALPVGYPEVVQKRRLTPRHLPELPIRDPPQPTPRRIRLIHHRLPLPVGELGTLQEISQCEWNDHARFLQLLSLARIRRRPRVGCGGRAGTPSWRAVVAVARAAPSEGAGGTLRGFPFKPVRAANTGSVRPPSPSGGWGARARRARPALTATGEPCGRPRCPAPTPDTPKLPRPRTT